MSRLCTKLTYFGRAGAVLCIEGVVCFWFNFGGSVGLGGGFWRPLSSARTDWEKSSFPFWLTACCLVSGTEEAQEADLNKDDEWVFCFEGTKVLFLVLLTTLALLLLEAVWMAAIFERLDEIRVSRSFLDGCCLMLVVGSVSALSWEKKKSVSNYFRTWVISISK